MADEPAATPLDRGEIADAIAESLEDLAELGDEGTDMETGTMFVEFNGDQPRRIATKIRSAFKKLKLCPERHAAIELGIRSKRPGTPEVKEPL